MTAEQLHPSLVIAITDPAKMKSVLCLLASAAVVASKEMAKNEELGAELYDSGLAHDRMMQVKMVSNITDYHGLY